MNMLRSRFKTLCPLALFLMALAQVCSAQNPSRQEIILPERIRLSTDLVAIDVQALNRKTGQVVTGLNAADFELYEDGVKQDITHFSQDRIALSVILLMDLSGSVSPVLKEIQSGALLALERLKESDEVAVIAFSSDTQLVQDFTADRKLIVDKIGHIDKTPVIGQGTRSEEHTSELQSLRHLVCRL